MVTVLPTELLFMMLNRDGYTVRLKKIGVFMIYDNFLLSLEILITVQTLALEMEMEGILPNSLQLYFWFVLIFQLQGK